jgi:hypothetical protein
LKGENYMVYYKCECGKSEYYESGMPPKDCEGCEDCKTTYATYKGGHKPLAPHEWETKYNENTGKPYRRCKKCYQKEKKSNLEKKQNEIWKEEFGEDFYHE